MATETLRHRIQDNSNVDNTVEDDNENYDDYDDDDNKTSTRRERWQAAIARHGYWSLTISVVGPASLLLLDIFFLRSAYKASANPSWIVDSYQLFSSVLISLASWFSWAENNGFHRPAMTVASLYFGFVATSVAWGPIVLGLGAIKVGILVTLVRLGFVLAIATMLKELNHTAGKCVMEVGGISGVFVFKYTLYRITKLEDLF